MIFRSSFKLRLQRIVEYTMVQTRGSSRQAAPSSAATPGKKGTISAIKSDSAGDQSTGPSKAQKRRAAAPAAAAKKKAATTTASQPSPDPSTVAVKASDSPTIPLESTLKKGTAAALCQAPFEATGQLYVGAHVSGAGGVWKAVREAHDIGARSFALFLASQRTWNRKPLSEEDAARFREAMQTYGYSGDLVVPHGSYLMNLGSPEAETRSKSCALLLDELQRCEKLGLPLFNFHPGSTCGKISREESIAHIARGINDALRATSGVTVLLENMSRQGNTLGGDLKELRAIIDLVDDQDRVGVCLDTCHAHAAGYDLSTEAGFRSLMDDFESVLGIHRLRAVHLNDSKSDVGSHVDRHENIGKGTIGRAGITRVLADRRFQRIPIVLETPYVDDDIYRREIKLLYGIIGA